MLSRSLVDPRPGIKSPNSNFIWCSCHVILWLELLGLRDTGVGMRWASTLEFGKACAVVRKNSLFQMSAIRKFAHSFVVIWEYFGVGASKHARDKPKSNQTMAPAFAYWHRRQLSSSNHAARFRHPTQCFFCALGHWTPRLLDLCWAFFIRAYSAIIIVPPPPRVCQLEVEHLFSNNPAGYQHFFFGLGTQQQTNL